MSAAPAILALAATPALGQYTAVATQTVQYNQQAVEQGMVQFTLGGGATAPENQNLLSLPNGMVTVSNYQVSTVTQSNYVDFADNATATGYQTQVSTSTDVQVKFQNTTNQSVNTTLNSSVVPAGFGFYIGDLSENPTTTMSGGSVNVPDINKTPESASATYGTSGLSGYTRNIGNISIDFSISTCANVDVCATQGPDHVYDYNAYLSLLLTDTGPEPQLSTNFATLLPSFAEITDNLSNFSYAWGATDITVPVGEMSAGATGYVDYQTSVMVMPQYNPASTDEVDLAYAGFGDPLGKGGAGGGVSDPDFPLLQLTTPSFDPTTGALNAAMFVGYTPALPLSSLNLDSSAAPEPGGWALMLAGLGLVGAALRHRTRAPAAPLCR